MIRRRCWRSSHFVIDLWVGEINPNRESSFEFIPNRLDVLQRAGIAPRDATPPPAAFEPIDTPTPIPRSPSVAAPIQSHSIKRNLSAVDVKAEEADALMDDDDEYTQREKVLLVCSSLSEYLSP